MTRTAGPDAMACDSCHNQPATGGSGDFAANVFVGAHFSDPPTTRTDLETTNERNTTGLFGSGLIELLAREMTVELAAQRAEALAEAARQRTAVKMALSAKGVSFGAIVALPDGTIDAAELAGVDYDLVVRPFGVKGIAASLREFSIAAMNQHHGMQAIERFGWERTGLRDFDADGVEEELSVGQVTALVVFQAQLPAPRQAFDADARTRDAETLGGEVFAQIGCTSCHVPSLPLSDLVFREPGPFNRPGAVIPRDVSGTVGVDLAAANGGGHAVKAYTDLKRHNLCDAEIRHFCNEERRQDNVATELFLTAKLWDAASSAPYGHRGDLRTLSAAIVNHGGEARPQREAFLALPENQKRAVIAFLRTLGRSQ
jgi:cytochrome c peroxidase